MTTLKLADGFTPPIELMTQKIAILARTGAGKTNTATVIAEEVLQRKQQVVALDPKGDWWGLRSSADGKEPGYAITVLGGDHGDLPLEPTAGALIADVAAEGVSLVIDLSAFTGRELRQFVTDFAERFYRAKAHHVSPVLLILEEADEVVPQRVDKDNARMVGAIERIVKRGRFRGIGTLLVTQRSASLNKDVLTQTEVLIVQQTTAPQDKKAIDAWVESHPDQDKRAELMANIASLKKGEAFVWSPTFLEIFQRVRFRMRRTFDAGRDVKIGELRTAPKVLAPVDLAALGERMKALGDRAKADDPRALRARVRELEAQVARWQSPSSHKVAKIVMQTVEKPVLKDAQITRLERIAERMDKTASDVLVRASELIAAARSARSGQPTTPHHVVGSPVRAAAPAADRNSPSTAGHPLASGQRPLTVRSGEPRAPSSLGRGERAVLIVVAQHDHASRDQISVLTGYKRSSRDTYIQRLLQAGYVALNGAGTVMATDDGVAALGDDYERLPTGIELQRYWSARLTGGEKAIYDILVGQEGQAVAREALDERTGYKRSSRDTYLQRLISRRLVVPVGRGEVAAAEHLFG